MSGWKQDYEDLIANYKAKFQIDQFLWEEEYNFGTIQSNLEKFENSLLHKNNESKSNDNQQESESEEEDDNSILETENQLFQFLQHVGVRGIEIDDGRVLPVYHVNEEKVLQTSYYFVEQFLKGRINNTMKVDVENGEEHVIIRVKGVLITLNQPNSRCFREILKWEEKTAQLDDRLL